MVNDRPYNYNITCFTNKGEFTMKKFVAVLSAAAMMTSLAACGSTADTTSTAASSSAAGMAYLAAALVTGLACTENPSSRITRLPNASAATRPDTAITACVPP